MSRFGYPGFAIETRTSLTQQGSLFFSRFCAREASDGVEDEYMYEGPEDNVLPRRCLIMNLTRLAPGRPS